MRTQAEKAQAFRALHEGHGAFLIPNPWGAGSARLLAHLGFEALATTSAGYAFSAGRCATGECWECTFAGGKRDARAGHVYVRGRSGEFWRVDEDLPGLAIPFFPAGNEFLRGFGPGGELEWEASGS